MSTILPISDDAKANRYRTELNRVLSDFGFNYEQSAAIVEDAERQVAEYQDGGYPPVAALVGCLLATALVGRCAEMPTNEFMSATGAIQYFWDIAAYGVDHRDNHLEDQKHGFKQKVN